MRLLHFTFRLEVLQRDIAGFRGAFANSMGWEHDLLHNHDAQSGGVHYRYPLVQYRSEKKQAGVVGINAGADAVLNWFARTQGKLIYQQEEIKLGFHNIDLCEYRMNFHDQPHRYRLSQWLPLNQQRYHEWQQLSGLTSRIAELERILAANILTFCRAVDWQLPQKFVLSISEISRTYSTGFLGNRHIAFDVQFDCDLVLPFGIGLGKGVSHGFGVCRPAPRPRLKIHRPTSVPSDNGGA